MVRIKACGMTNLDDCLKAQDLGIDFIGFVFHRQSKRFVLPQDARKMREAVGPSIKAIGVFVEESDEQMRRIIDYCNLDYAQVYRESSLANAIRAFRVADALPSCVPGEGLLLFDSFSDAIGGSGQAFPLDLVAGRPFLARAFIAGGINEQNVADVLRLKPFGVDLVSSLESCPGKKDHAKLERFVRTVRSLDP
jgi:phosphoribosylanthranilate isomerase